MAICHLFSFSFFSENPEAGNCPNSTVMNVKGIQHPEITILSYTLIIPNLQYMQHIFNSVAGLKLNISQCLLLRELTDDVRYCCLIYEHIWFAIISTFYIVIENKSFHTLIFTYYWFHVFYSFFFSHTNLLYDLRRLWLYCTRLQAHTDRSKSLTNHLQSSITHNLCHHSHWV